MKQKDKKLWMFLAHYILRKKGKVAAMIITTIVLVVIQVCFPFIWGKFILSMTLFSWNSIVKYILIISGLMFLEIVMQYLQSISVVSLMKSTNVEMQNDLYSKLLELNQDFYDKRKSAEFIMRIETDITRIVEIIINSFIPCITSVISIISMSFAMLYMNWQLAICVLCFFFINIYIYKIQTSIIRDNQKQIKEKQEEFLGILQQTLIGIRFIKLMNVKAISKVLFSNSTNDLNSKISELKQKIINVGCMSGISSIIGQNILYLLGAMFVWKEVMGIDYFITFYNYSQTFKSSSKTLVSFIPNLQEVLIALNRVYDIEFNQEIVEQFGDKNITVEKGLIDVHNLTFHYTDSPDILKNVQIRFIPKALNIISGESGGGKTTLINLIAKLYKVKDNTIFIDSTDINAYSETALRNAISVVTQEHFLFSMSIIDNFRMINPEISESEIKVVCKKCKIDDYISNLQDGYNTIIKENSSNLSVGQRQRLSLARALSRKASILILDEPTSALDSDTRFEIINLLLEIKKEITVIAITHDPQLIKFADMLYEL